MILNSVGKTAWVESPVGFALITAGPTKPPEKQLTRISTSQGNGGWGGAEGEMGNPALVLIEATLGGYPKYFFSLNLSAEEEGQGDPSTAIDIQSHSKGLPI